MPRYRWLENSRCAAILRVTESNLLAWCDGDPRTRYPAVAKLITPLANEKWTDLALSILRHAPDRAKVLKQYVGRFELDRWRGSRADAIESRAKLLDILPDLNDSGLEKYEIGRS